MGMNKEKQRDCEKVKKKRKRLGYREKKEKETEKGENLRAKQRNELKSGRKVMIWLVGMVDGYVKRERERES